MLWQPYAQMKTAPTPIKVVDAEGVYLYTSEGEKLIDSIASWWCMIHGYKRPKMTRAIAAQAKKMSHVMLGGLTHEPAERLAEKLAETLPGDLDYVFFSDSGSVAVEVALKMARQSLFNRGLNRPLTLALTRAYHGDTHRAMEVGDYRPHDPYLNSRGIVGDVVRAHPTIAALDEAFSLYGDRLNALIMEPRLQCAGGMKVYQLNVLTRARKLCDEYDVPLIFDEVATGFGRTGLRFVSDEVEPDIIVLGKALTGGYIGHAATVANRKIFESFYGDESELALMHGPTFMGNPLACAAALASIDIFEREKYMDKIKRIEEITLRETEGFEAPRLRSIRAFGGVVCFELTSPKDTVGYAEFARERGVFARPLGNVLYATPPYIIEEEELVRIVDVMKEFLVSPR